jgi:pimeloyl-ACP methyl ester carboxylesterase
MATFILVHGSWHGSWCWREVRPLLECRGHRAIPIDLPGHGADRTSPSDITMAHYVDAVVRAATAQREPPIVVVHSMGGLLGSVAEARPDALAAMVFIAPNLPPSGSTMLSYVDEYDPGFPACFVWAGDRRSASISAEGVRQFLYNRCAATIVDGLLPLFTPEPVAPFEATLTMTADRFGRVPRYFIETLHDRAVPLRLQRATQARVGFRQVFTLDTDHSPFFSAADDLAACLDSIGSQT